MKNHRNIVTIRQGSGTYIASSPGMVEDPLDFTFIGNKQKLINDLLEVRFLLSLLLRRWPPHMPTKKT